MPRLLMNDRMAPTLSARRTSRIIGLSDRTQKFLKQASFHWSPDPIESDRRSSFLDLRVFGNPALRVFTRIGSHFA
jgi:hypothetical protein